MPPKQYRTDLHRNPTAFTTDLAKQAGLLFGKDYIVGQSFGGDGHPVLYTAKLLGDPVALTIRLLDAVGFYTQLGTQRWSYIAMPSFVWNGLEAVVKRHVIGFMYRHEGGTAMRDLFV